MRIGVVGLGRMGLAVSQRLLSLQHEVLGWDHNVSANAQAATHGVRIVAQAADLAAADHVLVLINDDADGLRHVFTGPAGLLAGGARSVLQMTSGAPHVMRELQALCVTRSTGFYDAQVLGSTPQAREGKWQVLLGCAHQDIAAIQPLLEQISRRVIHMGPVGAGAAMQLAVNVGLASYIQALAEALALGASQGLSVATMLDVFNDGSIATRWLSLKTPVIAGSQESHPTLDIATLRRDVLAAVATAALAELSLPQVTGALTVMNAACAQGFGAIDDSEIPTLFRRFNQS